MIIGIDFGTTFSLMSFVGSDGESRLVPDIHENNTFKTPSSVVFLNGDVYVGDSAEQFAEFDKDIRVNKYFKFGFTNIQTIESHEVLERHPVALAAMVIKKLLKDYKVYVGDRVEGAVITVPSYFSNEQRRLVKCAGEIAGLEQILITEEPIAAACFYGTKIPFTEKTLFVYDFGGGTFDATVVHVSESGFETLFSTGVNNLGGTTIDSIIAGLIHKKIGYEFTKDDIPLSSVIEAKHRLCKPGARVFNSSVANTNTVKTYSLTKEEVFSAIKGVVEETINVCKFCLEKSNLSKVDIDEIMLVGGSSMIPLVKQSLADFFGVSTDLLILKQPHHAVALGAGKIANCLFGNDDALDFSLVAHASLGIMLRDGETNSFYPVIHQGKKLPFSSSIDIYRNGIENENMVLDLIEKRESHNTSVYSSVGSLQINVSNLPLSEPINLELGYDKEGVVKMNIFCNYTSLNDQYYFKYPQSLKKSEIQILKNMVQTCAVNPI